MVKIRLKRMGSKKNAFYRIVVSDVNKKRDGKVLAELGYYDAVKSPAVIKLDEELALHWLELGAQPTDTARNILSKHGVMQKYHENKQKK